MPRITILVNDLTSRDELDPAHGFAALIEDEDRRVLFDTGPDAGVLVKNAEELGIRLRPLDALILSHGHYDHTGGVEALFAQPLNLHAHPDVFLPKFARRSRWKTVASGMQHTRADLEAAGFRCQVSTAPQNVGPGWLISGEIDRDEAFVPQTPHLLADSPDGRVADPLLDDLALTLRTPKGLIVLTGCAHAGIINILHAAVRTTGDERLRAVLGGFHLLGSPPEQIRATLDEFRRLGVKKLYPCHCTGDHVIDQMCNEFTDRCHPLAAGDRVSF